MTHASRAQTERERCGDSSDHRGHHWYLHSLVLVGRRAIKLVDCFSNVKDEHIVRPQTSLDGGFLIRVKFGEKISQIYNEKYSYTKQ